MFGVFCFQLEVMSSLGQMLSALLCQLCSAAVSAWLCAVCGTDSVGVVLCDPTAAQHHTAPPSERGGGGGGKSNYNNIYIYIFTRQMMHNELLSTCWPMPS